MNDIEERATEFALKEIRCKSVEELELWGTEVAKKAFEEIRNDYIRIATEQKAIDDANYNECIKEITEANADHLDCMVKLTEKDMIDKAIKFTCGKCGCMVNGATDGYKVCPLHREPRKTCMVVKTLIKTLEA